ncbi:MAG: hypothetical protein WC371_04090, partial [Parachlamydiales bacterium]
YASVLFTAISGFDLVFAAMGLSFVTISLISSFALDLLNALKTPKAAPFPSKAPDFLPRPKKADALLFTLAEESRRLDRATSNPDGLECPLCLEPLRGFAKEQVLVDPTTGTVCVAKSLIEALEFSRAEQLKKWLEEKKRIKCQDYNIDWKTLANPAVLKRFCLNPSETEQIQGLSPFSRLPLAIHDLVRPSHWPLPDGWSIDQDVHQAWLKNHSS